MTSFLFSKKKNLVHDKNDIKCILEKKKKKRFCCPLVHIYMTSECLAYFSDFAVLIGLPT